MTEKHDDESASEKIDTAAPPTLTRLQPDGDGHKQVLERIRIGEYAVRQRTSELRAFNRAQRIDAIWTGGGIRVALAPQDSPGPLSRTKLDEKTKAEPAKRADPVSFELRTVAAARGSARVAIPAKSFHSGVAARTVLSMKWAHASDAPSRVNPLGSNGGKIARTGWSRASISKKPQLRATVRRRSASS